MYYILIIGDSENWISKLIHYLIPTNHFIFTSTPNNYTHYLEKIIKESQDDKDLYLLIINNTSNPIKTIFNYLNKLPLYSKCICWWSASCNLDKYFKYKYNSNLKIYWKDSNLQSTPKASYQSYNYQLPTPRYNNVNVFENPHTQYIKLSNIKLLSFIPFHQKRWTFKCYFNCQSPIQTKVIYSKFFNSIQSPMTLEVVLNDLNNLLKTFDYQSVVYSSQLMSGESLFQF